MFNKRANIMFDQRTWDDLTVLAKKRKTTVGVLVRDAVEQTYITSTKRERIATARKRILAIRPLLKGIIDYKSLIEEGRER